VDSRAGKRFCSRPRNGLNVSAKDEAGLEGCINMHDSSSHILQHDIVTPHQCLLASLDGVIDGLVVLAGNLGLEVEVDELRSACGMGSCKGLVVVSISLMRETGGGRPCAAISTCTMIMPPSSHTGTNGKEET